MSWRIKWAGDDGAWCYSKIITERIDALELKGKMDAWWPERTHVVEEEQKPRK